MKKLKSKWFFLLIPIRLGFCISTDLIKSCKDELSRIASYATHVNSQLVPKFVRSKNYVKHNSEPSDFWRQVKENPRVFESAVEYRVEHLKRIFPKYEEILRTLDEKNEITPTLAKQITLLESDPILNSVLDEHSTISDFEKHILPKFYENEKILYKKNLSKFNEVALPLIEIRKKLRNKLSPGHLSHAEAKLILEDWLLFHTETDLHPDSLPDWITGADASLSASNDYLDPKSGHQTGYGASPLRILQKSISELPLKKGDTVLDVGSGWGRILMTGALLYPDLNFSGVEYVQERANFMNQALDKMKISNAQNKQMDASGSEIESEVKKAKAVFLFNSFSPPALKLFIERTKSVVKQTQQTKYLIAANEHIFPFSLEEMGLKVLKKTNADVGEYNQFTIYRIDP